ncbi:MAG: futalosine hydrolase [Bacteroidia bacterium]
MKILIVSATKFEIDPLLKKMEIVHGADSRLFSCKYKKLEIDFLITGVGMVATAYYSGKAINDSYDAAFNLGICGSFNSNLEIGTVVNIYEDCFSELGAEDGDEFLSLEDLKLDGVTKIKNNYGTISIEIEKLPKVNGITVNTTHGNEKTIEKIAMKFHPIIESMEGAAFMLVCENEKIPYAQIRAVSNFVERRNKDRWNIPLAIKNLNDTFIKILDSF